jgi:hypothetical protein
VKLDRLFRDKAADRASSHSSLAEDAGDLHDIIHSGQISPPAAGVDRPPPK